MKRSFFILCSVFIFFIALIYRFQTLHSPFWVDEFSSAHQAQLLLRYGAEVFTNPHVHWEKNNIITHVLIAISFSVFGQSEFAARLPFMVIGSLVPAAIFSFGIKFFNKRTAFLASFLSICSYFLITWSRQARGYVLLELCILVAAFAYCSIIKEKRIQSRYLFVFVVSSIIGLATHVLFSLFLIAVGIHYLFLKGRVAQSKIKMIGVVAVGCVCVVFAKSIFHIQISFVNNIWYYHSFLWREYSFLVILSLLGMLMRLAMKKLDSQFILSYMVVHLLFICFLFGPYVTRYILPIFPFVLLFFAFSLQKITQLFFEHELKDDSVFIQCLFLIFIGCFIVFSGDKFTVKPKTFYSVNHDFREIALIDYDKVYQYIKNKGQFHEGKTAIVETWADRAEWYLGLEYKPVYFLRWKDNPELLKRLDYEVNEQGEKVTEQRRNVIFVLELVDLQKVLEKYPKGFIWIDDTTLSPDIIEYAEQHFKKEMVVDHYTLDDNPYSLWPATLYSWGI